jgi:hypothetical protein
VNIVTQCCTTLLTACVGRATVGILPEKVLTSLNVLLRTNGAITLKRKTMDSEYLNLVKAFTETIKDKYISTDKENTLIIAATDGDNSVAAMFGSEDSVGATVMMGMYGDEKFKEILTNAVGAYHMQELHDKLKDELRHE